jgi:hypothetical protein
MLRHQGGDQVKGGFFWKMSEWEIVTLEGKSGVLPGGAECSYLRVPAPLFVPVALLLSGIYVIFLPLIGFVMLVGLLGRKAGKGLGTVIDATERRVAELLRMVASSLRARARIARPMPGKTQGQ